MSRPSAGALAGLARLCIARLSGVCLVAVAVLAVTAATPLPAGAALNPAPPAAPVKLIFIHHSTGQAWLEDGHGGLGIALRDNNYFVSDTNYGWGPSSIGDSTDLGHWWTWFRGSSSATYLSALYAESETALRLLAPRAPTPAGPTGSSCSRAASPTRS